jgi:hypothetical protein
MFNDGSSAPSVAYSLVEGGLSAGSVEGSGNVYATAEFADSVGADAFRGTSDDDLTPASAGVSVDAGDDASLPADRFDLDGDGDTAESIPIDLAGRERIADGGSGSAVVDVGALEFGAMSIARESQDDAPSRSFRLDPPYPNPAAETATVSFVAGGLSHARVVVYDMLGREVMLPFDGPVSPGAGAESEIDVSSLPAGVYLIRLEAGSRHVETRLTVAR